MQSLHGLMDRGVSHGYVSCRQRGFFACPHQHRQRGDSQVSQFASYGAPRSLSTGAAGPSYRVHVIALAPGSSGEATPFFESVQSPDLGWRDMVTCARCLGNTCAVSVGLHSQIPEFRTSGKLLILQEKPKCRAVNVTKFETILPKDRAQIPSKFE